MVLRIGDKDERVSYDRVEEEPSPLTALWHEVVTQTESGDAPAIALHHLSEEHSRTNP